MPPADRVPQPAPLRAGSVPYLNVAPLVPGLEGRLRLLPPSQLAVALRQGDIDAGLLSITEALFHEGYDILDGPCVASRGSVLSVFLAHRTPLQALRRIHCDTASLTSVNLLRVLLAEQGLFPELLPLPPGTPPETLEDILLIGDPALRFLQGAPAHAILDLGEAWQELTALPFVYAAWVLRRDADTLRLRAELQAAARRGRQDLDRIIREASPFDEAFRRRYLTRHVHSQLGALEKQGIARFAALLRRHAGRPVHEPRYVS